MQKTLEKKVIYPELSYQIIGASFDVFNELGFGMSEKYYQKAFAKELERRDIQFVREQLVRLDYKGQPMGRYSLDFVVNKEVVVELKVRPRLGYVHIKQTIGYLKTTGHKLAIIIYFTPEGIKYRRVLNVDS